VVQCGQQDVTEYHVACGHAHQQVRVSWSMKSDRQARDSDRPALTRRGLLVSVDNCPSGAQRNATSLRASTSPVLSLALKSSRRQQPSEPHAAPAMFTQL